MNTWTIFDAIAAVVLLYVLLRYRVGILKFVGEVKVELDKCAWPWDPNQSGFGKKYKELIESTWVVILAVILLAGFVTTSDWLLTHLVGWLTGTGIATMHTAVATPPLH
jgi:preprotein translocase subunit SecE